MPNAAEQTKLILDLLAAGDVDSAVAHIDDSFISREAASLPYGGDHIGKQGFINIVTTLGKTWDDFDFRIHDIVGSGDVATVFETIYGKVGGEAFEMPVIEIWRYRDGKVIEATPYYHDTHLLFDLRQRHLA